MSRTIDERVVSMQFDNKQFESNVRTSMSTIERLKQSLNFSGSAKGLENLNSSVKNVNMSALGNGVDSVTAKFSALQVMGVTALANLTNSAVNAGKRIAAALTIEPIKTGLQEYETQINAVQTILANTQSKGTTLDDVNAALDELNTYADKTIYNFTEMTRNIGTFTAAGVDLETSVNAIQGIANLAAVSGSTSQQASTAMYQLSQALAAGTIRLMDWNSVVNAGMGGEVFQNALKETSELLGTGAEEAIKATGSFRESLREEWLTAEVLTETLKKFTTTGASEYIAEYTGLERKMIDAKIESIEKSKDEAAAIEEASKALAEKSGKNKDEIKSALEMAFTAQNAATKVKTFTQLMDTLKESIQSGWTQTWEILIGDFEEAKELWSGISDFLTGDNGLITKMSNARNEVLEGAMTSGWDKLINKINEAGVSTGEFETRIKEALGTDVVKKLTEEHGSLKAAVKAGAVEYDVLKKALSEVKNVMVDLSGVKRELKFGDTGEDVKKIQEALTKLGYELPKFGVDGLIKDETTAAIKAFQKAEGLEVTGIVDEKTLDVLDKACTKTSELEENIDDLIKGVTELGGREMLIEGLKNVFKALGSVLAPIGKAFSEIFSINSDQLYNAIKGFNDFTKRLKVSEETISNIQRTFKGLFAIVDIVAKVIGGTLKFAFDKLIGPLGGASSGFLEITANIGDAIVGFREFLTTNNRIAKGIEYVADALWTGAKKIGEWIAAFLELPEIQNGIDALLDKLKGLKQVGLDAIEGLRNGLQEGVLSIPSILADIGRAMLEAIKAVLGIHSPSKEMEKVGENAIQGLINGITKLASNLWGTIKGVGEKLLGYFQTIPWDKLLAVGVSVGMFTVLYKVADALKNIGSALGGFGNIMDELGDGIERISKAQATKLKSEALLNMAKSIGILAIALIALSFVPWQKLAVAGTALIVLAGILIGISYAMNELDKASVSINKKGLNINGLKSGLVGIGIAILLIAGTVALIGKLDPDAAKQGFIGLSGVLTALIVFVGLYGNLVKGEEAANIDKLGKMLKKLSVSLLLMVAVIKLVSLLDASEMVKGALFATGFVIFIAALAKASKTISSDADKLGSMILKVSFALGLLVGVCKLIDLLEYREMGKGLIFALGFTAFVKALVWSTKVGKGDQFTKVGGLVMSVSASLLLMVGVCKLVGTLSTSELIKGGVFIAAFVGLIAALVKITTVGPEQQIGKVAGTLIAMSVAIGIMAGVSILLGMIDTGYLAKGIIAVGMLSALMSLMVHSAKGVGDIKDNLIVMTVAIGLMAAAVAALSLIPTKNLAASTAAMVSLMAGFALMVSSAKSVGNTKGLLKTLVTMTGVILVLAGLVAILSKIEKPDAALKNSAAVAILMTSLAVSMKLIDKVGKDSVNAAKNMAPMLLVVAGVAAILGLMSKLDAEASIPSAIALGILINTMATAMLILSKVKMGSGGASMGKNIASLTAMVIPLSAFAAALQHIPMDNIAGKKDALIVLAGVMGAMTVLMLAVSAIGKVNSMMGGGMLTGLVGLTAMCGLLAGLAWALNSVPMDTLAGKKDSIILLTGVMTIMSGLLLVVSAVGAIYMLTGGIAATGLLGLTVMLGLFAGFAWALNSIPMDNLSKNKESIMMLTDIMKTLTELLLQVSIVAPLAIVGVAAMAGLTGLMVAIGLLAVGIGALMEKFPAVQEFLNTGIPVLVQLASGIGEMIGAFVGGVMTTIADGLPEIGANLSAFMNNAASFIAGSKLVDESVVNGAKYLATAIIALTAADLIAGISSFLQGGSSFVDLGFQLSQFAAAALPFFSTARMVDEGSMLGIKALAEALMIITSASLLERILSWVSGASSMSTFATQLSQFGDAVVAFSSKVSGNIDEGAVIAAANAGKSIAQLYDSLPKTGGWMQTMFGEANIGTFAAQLSAFGVAITSFSTKVKGNIDESAVTAAANAGKTISGLYNAIPKGGGWMQEIFGEANLATFGQQLVAFGEAITGFSAKVKGNIDEGAVTAAANAGKVMATLASSLPEDGSVWDIFSSKDKMNFETFGTQITAFGQAMADFSSKVSEGFDSASVGSATSAAKQLISLFKSMGGVDTENVDKFRDAVKSLGKAKVEKFYESFTADKAENAASAVRKIVNLIKSMAGMDASGVSTFKDALSNLATVEITGFVDAFSSAASKLAKAGTDMMNGLVNGITTGTPRVTSAVKNVVTKTFSDIQSMQGKFMSAGRALMDKLASGLKQSASKARSTVKTAISQALSVIVSAYSSFYANGKYIGSGLVAGLNAKQTAAYNAGYALGQAAAQGVADGGGVASPSKLTIASGKFMGEGLIIGIGRMGSAIYKAGHNIGELATDSISDAISKVSDFLDSDMDTNPTITPVLDLTNVTEGANGINRLFSTNRSVGLMANIGAASASIGSRRQNGANDDVVSAINKLRNDISNLQTNSYNINGISYDDGTNVAAAVGDLTRALKMGRRT